MYGRSIIESLGDIRPHIEGMMGVFPVDTLHRERLEIAHVAATASTERVESAESTILPALSMPKPDPGYVRIWTKYSEFNPRVLDVFVTDKTFLAVVEWPRDYYDVAEDDVLLATGRENVLEDHQATVRAVVAYRLAQGAPGVHRTFAVEHGAWGDEFEVYEEYEEPLKALKRFEGLKGEPEDGQWSQGGLRDEKETLLRVNGVYGLTETRRGHRLLGAIVDAARAGRFKTPLKYAEYTEAVDDPLAEEEVGALVNLGILCSRCPGMTWGDTGYELMRGLGC
jgi:hypothetical protein